MQYADVMHQFAARHSLEDLTDETLKHLYDGNFSIDKAHDFIDFYRRLEAELLTHPVITDNDYTRWFRGADLRDAEVRHFLVQFSVVANQLLIARAHRVVNASSLDQMRQAKRPLLDELGVSTAAAEPAADGFPAVTPAAGGIEGGVFHFDAARFEQLLGLAEQLGLGFADLGRRDLATPGTLFFCDELIRLYGSTDFTTAEAAAFTIDNWSTCLFWRDLVAGLKHYQQSRYVTLPAAVFDWQADDSAPPYNKEQLENSYFTSNLDEDLYLEKGYEMLDAVHAFWKGLDEDRKRLH